MKRFLRALALGISLAGLGLAHAQPTDYPNKPITYVVPFPAGGLTDTMARLVGQELSKAWKQPVVVENKGGGNGNIGAAAVARAPADGYTLLAITLTHAVNQSLFQNLSYSLEKNFTPVAGLATSPLVLVVNPSLPVKSVKELAEYAKTRRLNGGSSGNGTPPHLGLELLSRAIGSPITHVPYKGGAPSVTDLLGGQIELIVANLPEVIQYIKRDKLRPLAVTSNSRHPLLPDVPTMTEAGYPDVMVENWTGLLVPSGTPKDVVAKIAAEALAAVKKPEVQDKIKSQGFQVTGLGPGQFGALLHEEVPRWGKLIATANIHAD